MDLGIVAKRYAKTLLKFAVERGTEDIVYQQMEQLCANFEGTPQLLRTLQDPVLDDQQKLQLLQASVKTAEKQTDETLQLFFQLTLKNHRADLLPFIAHTYMDLCLNYKGKAVGKLTTPVPVTADVERQICDLLQQKTNKNILFKKQVDPTIQGGFVLEVDHYMLDASLKTQLAQLHRKLSQVEVH